MKRCTILFILALMAGLCLQLHGDTTQDTCLELLTKILGRKLTCNYVSTVEAPFREWSDITEARYYRRYDPETDFVSIRLECYIKNDCVAVFLVNPDGQFAQDTLRGTWFSGGDFKLLFRQEIMSAPFCQSELDDGKYLYERRQVNGRSGAKITWMMPCDANDIEALKAICGIDGLTEKNLEEFCRIRPFRREFTIDLEKEIVVYRREFPLETKRPLSYMSMGNVSWDIEWEENEPLFKTPANVKGLLRSDDDFRKYLNIKNKSMK